MENNMMVTTEGEIIESTGSPIDNLVTTSIDEFRRDAFHGTLSRLSKVAHATSNSDAILHAGTQLKTADILNHVLTIIAAQYAYVPDGDSTKRYPVVVFAEAPGYWYNMGQLGSNLIEAWVNEMGDDPEESPYLPMLNQELTDCGGVRVHFRLKKSKEGRDYVAITVA